MGVHNHAAVIGNAIKASGVVVKLDPESFGAIVAKNKNALIVYSTGGFLSTSYKYLMSYKGLAFYTKSDEPISLPRDAEIVEAENIWVPE